MTNEELEIEIRPDGQVSIRTIGIKGPACIEAAKEFLELIRGKEVESTKTAEYYETESGQVNEQVQSWNRWES